MDPRASEEPVYSPDDEKPEIFAVSRDANGLSYSRRDFIEVTGVAAAGLALSGAIIGGAEMSPEVLATCTVRASRSNLNMRSGPGTTYKKLGYFPKDKDIPVTGQAKASDGSEWWQVRVPDVGEAWVSKRFVTASGSCSAIPTVSPGAGGGRPAAPTAAPNPGQSGNTLNPGDTGINYEINGQTYTLPCGSAIPDGAVCVCNCVTVPQQCNCDAHTYCECDTVCTCDTVESHYWYPN